MPRNGSGVYTLPAGQPVSTGTIIDSTVFNTLTSDLQTALTNSLAKNGETTPTANIPLGTFKITGLGDATVATDALNRQTADARYPQIAAVSTITANYTFSNTQPRLFFNDTDATANNKNYEIRNNSGVLSIIADDDSFSGVLTPISITRNGNTNITSVAFDALVVSSTGQIQAPDGAVGTPSHSFTSDPDTGMFRTGANEIRFSTGGTLAALFQSSTRNYLGGAPFTTFADGNVNFPALSFESDQDTGMYRVSANRLGFAVNATQLLDITSTSVECVNGTGVQLLFPGSGVTASPGLAFGNDPDTGFFRNAANSVGVSAGGTFTAEFRLNAAAQIGAIDGTTATPIYSFNSDYDTGLYRTGSGDVSFSADNSRVFRMFAAASGGAQVADSGGTLQTVGYRQIPRSTTATTLVANDVAKCVAITAAINIPASVFSAGDAISIYNDSAGALNITISAGTLRLGGTATTGTRSLAARGMATLWFNVGGATPEVIASGNVS